MPLSFPANPTVGQTYTVGTRTWTWTGSIWSMQAATLGVASISTSELADSAVTTAKIANANVTAAKLAATAAIQPTIVNAKGDLIVGTADDTVARQGVGATNGQLLVVDSTTATGLGYKLIRNYKPPSGGMIRPVANQGSATPAQSRLFFFPIEIASCTANLMWFGYVGTGVAGATVRGGIYDSDSSGFPGSLLLDAGTIDASTTGYKSIAINITLSSGRFWLAGVSQGGAPTVQIQTNTQMFSLGFQRSFAGFDVQYWSSLHGTNPQPLYQDNVTGALPATATPGYTNSVTSGHLIGLRIA